MAEDVRADSQVRTRYIPGTTKYILEEEAEFIRSIDIILPLLRLAISFAPSIIFLRYSLVNPFNRLKDLLVLFKRLKNLPALFIQDLHIIYQDRLCVVYRSIRLQPADSVVSFCSCALCRTSHRALKNPLDWAIHLFYILANRIALIVIDLVIWRCYLWCWFGLGTINRLRLEMLSCGVERDPRLLTDFSCLEGLLCGVERNVRY